MLPIMYEGKLQKLNYTLLVSSYCLLFKLILFYLLSDVRMSMKVKLKGFTYLQLLRKNYVCTEAYLQCDK